jgi:hypothetical protein
MAAKRILVVIMLLIGYVLFAQMSRSDMQKMYTGYLSSNMGYSSFLVNDGSVVFDDRQENRYIIFINTGSSFQMGCYDQYLGETYAMDSLNKAKIMLESHLKDVAVIFNGGNEPGGWFMANIRLSRPEDFTRVFPRLLYSLRIARDLFYIELFKQEE